MPPPLDVDREQVRMLVLELGCTEAAKRTGIPLNTVLSWSARGEWLKPVIQELPPTVRPRAINAISSPADALKAALDDDSQATRVAGLRYSKLVTQHAASLAEASPNEALAQAPLVKAALQGAALAGNWAGQNGDQNTVLAFFTASAPTERDMGEVVEVEPSE